MNAKLTFAEPRPSRTVATAALATVIALSLLWGVAALFQSRGEPLGQLAAAERACAELTYQSEREECMREWIARAQATEVARR
jgi:hypothetical protein